MQKEDKRGDRNKNQQLKKKVINEMINNAKEERLNVVKVQNAEEEECIC